nr:MAG TPA: hypothetical protein [Caudoviricetes sp.]
MTTIEKLQQLGAAQYIDFSFADTKSLLECYLCNDRDAEAIQAIRILNDGCGMILEVKLGEIMMHKASTVYITIEDNEMMDLVEASDIKMENVEVIYSSDEADNEDAAMKPLTKEQVIELVSKAEGVLIATNAGEQVTSHCEELAESLKGMCYHGLIAEDKAPADIAESPSYEKGWGVYKFSAPDCNTIDSDLYINIGE